MKPWPALLLLTIATACQPPAPAYAPTDQATLDRLRAAAAARQAARDLRDAGAESAQPASGRLFGIDESAARRLFLVDASGSMRDHLDALRSHLTRAIADLPPQTAFDIVTFADDDFTALAPQWLLADPAGKARAASFVASLKPYGNSDAVPALSRAFALRPQTIYLLTDGDFPNTDRLVSTFRRLSANHGVTVHVITLADPVYDGWTLKQLASDHHGQYVRLR